MGRIHLSDGILNLTQTDYWRCLICDELVYKGNLLPHIKVCSCQRIKSHFNNNNAIRCHILLYLFGSLDELDPSIDLSNLKQFIIAIYTLIYEIRIGYTDNTEYLKLFNPQEIFIILMLKFSLTYFNVPIIEKFIDTLIENDFELDILNESFK
jgi:hypothetical protein